MAYKYWNTKEAALDLAKALDEVKRLEVEGLRYGYSKPYWHEKDVADAVGRVRGAVRYLCPDESGDTGDQAHAASREA